MDQYTALQQLGQYYRKHRKMNLMTQAKLAEDSHLSDKYISRLERGEENPTYLTLYNLSKALNLPCPMIDQIQQDDDT
ncbi:helix-turn-helix domain-containing protein [Virgibacillus ainsalahensis]